MRSMRPRPRRRRHRRRRAAVAARRCARRLAHGSTSPSQSARAGAATHAHRVHAVARAARVWHAGRCVVRDVDPEARLALEPRRGDGARAATRPTRRPRRRAKQQQAPHGGARQVTSRSLEKFQSALTIAEPTTARRRLFPASTLDLYCVVATGMDAARPAKGHQVPRGPGREEGEGLSGPACRRPRPPQLEGVQPPNIGRTKAGPATSTRAPEAVRAARRPHERSAAAARRVIVGQRGVGVDVIHRSSSCTRGKRAGARADHARDGQGTAARCSVPERQRVAMVASPRSAATPARRARARRDLSQTKKLSCPVSRCNPPPPACRSPTSCCCSSTRLRL